MTEPTAPREPDDRAERALRDALQANAGGPVFRPLKLDLGAKPPRPWTRWLPAAAALMLVAVVAVPLALSQNSGGRGPVAAVPADGTAERTSARAPAAAHGSPTPVQDWRWESYRVLSYRVPMSWGYGWAPASDWCSAGRYQSGYGAIVDVAPERRAIAAIACPRAIPSQGLPMFVTVHAVGAADRGWDLPEGWAIASTELDGYRLEVVHPDREARVAGEIVASVRPIGKLDPNGCRAVAGPPEQSDPNVAVPDRVSLCQYDLGKSRQLLASKQLAEDAAVSVFDALRQAPRGTGPDDTSCKVVGDTEVIVRLWQGDVANDVAVRYSGCRGNGVTGLGRPRRLTREACRAVMVPPITFTTGFGKAGRLCAPDPIPSPSPVPTGEATASPTPSR